MPILNMVWWWKKWGNIWEPLNLTVTISWLDATITWEDNEISTIPPTTFQKSELVRKIGSAPTSPSDWVLVVTETVKDTYKTTWYVDSWLTAWTTYYYRVFSYSDLGGISYCDAVSVEIDRLDLDQYSLLATKTLSWFSNPHWIAVSEDGLKLYIWPASWTIRQYTMTGGLLSNISALESTSSSITTRWLFCKPDGSKLFSTSDNKRRTTITMPTAYSLTWSSSSYVTWIYGAQGPTGIWFTPDGDYYFVCDWMNYLYKVPLGTAWDMTTATTTGMTSIHLTSWNNLYNVAISPTWLKLFIWDWGWSSCKIYQYNLSTARDITTATYSWKSLWSRGRATFSVTWTWSIFVTDTDISTPTVYQYTAS